jgi:hypothetical protein
MNTVELLTLIYNSDVKSTAIQKIESVNLRKKLIKEVLIFNGHLHDFDDDILPNEYKERSKAQIQGHLSNKSLFTAFKRWIVRDNEHLAEVFGQYCQ